MRYDLKAAATAAVLATGANTVLAETTSVNGAQLYYETVGTGPPILMMHGGLGLSHDYLRPYFDQLSETHTVVYYDHFGNGRSASPDDYGEMTFDRMTSDADALMTQLGHETFTLIGHSYGGFIAQEFAARYQDRLDGLVLIDTVPAFDYQPTVAGTDEQMAAFGKLFSQPMADDADWQATWNPVVEMYFHQWDAAVGADLDARTVYNHKAWNASGALLGSFNMLEQLPTIETPTLAIAGKHDPITVAEHGAERIAGLMPNATLLIFEASGHYPFIEEEAAFFDALKGWLSR
ncbi:alpha/beta hydrolase [Yoonia sp. BS5-3]|uniref:Alpha/beta fold hydrolase n=1 Tax=Yoonia phaeophyticola TaxID=3137369 RepID=A0ABZ2V786_9RHOB